MSGSLAAAAWPRQLGSGGAQRGGGSLAVAAWQRQLGGSSLAAAAWRQQLGGGSLAAAALAVAAWRRHSWHQQLGMAALSATAAAAGRWRSGVGSLVSAAWRRQLGGGHRRHSCHCNSFAAAFAAALTSLLLSPPSSTLW